MASFSDLFNQFSGFWSDPVGNIQKASAARQRAELVDFSGGQNADSTASAKAGAEQAAAAERAEAAVNRDFSAAEAQKARDWQKYYERNKYVWNMQGMRAAGLNPILAYQLMSGGSASSAVAQPTKANIASAYSAEYNRIVGESANAVRGTASILSLIAVLGAVLLRAGLK